jgi:hypothetical protein
MLGLTKQQQVVLATVLAFLLVGWVVKVYRTAHTPTLATTQQRP